MGSPDSDGEEGWPQQLLLLCRHLPRGCFDLSPNDEQRECSCLQVFSETQSVKLWALSLLAKLNSPELTAQLTHEQAQTIHSLDPCSVGVLRE